MRQKFVSQDWQAKSEWSHQPIPQGRMGVCASAKILQSSRPFRYQSLITNDPPKARNLTSGLLVRLRLSGYKQDRPWTLHIAIRYRRKQIVFVEVDTCRPKQAQQVPQNPEDPGRHSNICPEPQINRLEQRRDNKPVVKIQPARMLRIFSKKVAASNFDNPNHCANSTAGER